MANSIMATLRNALEIYETLCQPVCRSAGILNGELNILMFLAEHPGKDTAKDVCTNGGMKQSMISTLVERLVQGGYLERQPVPGDRRKVRLVCTEKAAPVIEAGREVKQKMYGYLCEGITKEDSEAFRRVMGVIERNALECREKIRKGALE